MLGKKILLSLTYYVQEGSRRFQESGRDKLCKFSRDQIRNILGFTGRKIPVTTTQCCHFSLQMWVTMLRRTRWTVRHSLQALRRQEGLPQWASGKRICLQCRRHRFNPRAGKTPRRRAWQLTPAVWLVESQSRGAWCTEVHGVAKSCTRLKRRSSSTSLQENGSRRPRSCGHVTGEQTGQASGTLWFNFGFALC